MGCVTLCISPQEMRPKRIDLVGNYCGAAAKEARYLNASPRSRLSTPFDSISWRWFHPLSFKVQTSKNTCRMKNNTAFLPGEASLSCGCAWGKYWARTGEEARNSHAHRKINCIPHACSMRLYRLWLYIKRWKEKFLKQRARWINLYISFWLAWFCLVVAAVFNAPLQTSLAHLVCALFILLESQFCF